MKEEAGYTLAELNVAVLLALLVSGFFFSAYLFASRGIERWQARLGLENTLHLSLRRVVADVRRARTLAFLPGGGVRLEGPAGDAVIYRLAPDGLRRNGRRMHPEDLVLRTFTLIPLAETPAADPFSPAGVEVHLGFERRGVIRSARTFVTRRGPPPWPLPPHPETAPETNAP